LILALTGVGGARGDEDQKTRRLQLVQPVVSTWRIGVEVRAGEGPASGIVASAPIPRDWPEQKVVRQGEEKTPNVTRISFRDLEDGVRQMVVTIPRLAAGETARAVVTLQITKFMIEPPAEVGLLRPPAGTLALRKYLQPSPFIESRDPQVVALASQIGEGLTGWAKAKALFDWVQANVKYEFAETIKPATAALADRRGDCEELSSLFIALCRASQIPARAVWVPGHAYPEFYLVDDRGEGQWFPCQIAGEGELFGAMHEARPILQKGDHFIVPGQRTPQRYVAPLLTARDAAAPLTLRPILERVPSP
jgi:transglutaminase-like putative cysteine protease